MLYVIIKINRADTGYYHLYTTGLSEVVSLDGVERQFVTGLKIDSLDVVSSVGTFETANQTIEIAETTAGYWQNLANNTNIIHTDVVIMKKIGGVLTEATALYQGKIVEYGVKNGLFFLTLKDRFSDFARVGKLEITAEKYPNAPSSSIGQQIPVALGNLSQAEIPLSDGPGAINAYCVSTVGTTHTYAIDAIGAFGETESIEAVYVSGSSRPFTLAIETTENGTKRLLITLTWATCINPVQVYGKFNVLEYRLLNCLVKLGHIMGYTEIVVPGETPANNAFNTVMESRGFQNSWWLAVSFLTSSGYSMNEIIDIFQKCFSCDLRISQGKLEGKAYDFWNGIPSQCSFQLEPSDILTPGIEEAKVTTDSIVNRITGNYRYNGTTGANLLKNAVVGVNAKNSIAAYTEHPEEIDFRFAYQPGTAQAMKKFYLMRNFQPKVTLTMSVLESRIPSTFAAGDMFSLVDSKDLTAGKEYRYYQAQRMTRDVIRGKVTMVCRDITDLAKMDRYNRLLIAGDCANDTDLRNNSTTKSNNIVSYNIKQVSDAGALTGVCWEPSGAGSYIWVQPLYFSPFQSQDVVTINDFVTAKEFQLSIRFKMSGLTTDQTLYFARSQNSDTSYHKVSFVTASKAMRWRYVDASLGYDYSLTTVTNSVNDTNWHNIVVWIFERSTGYYRVRVFLDGVQVTNSFYISSCFATDLFFNAAVGTSGAVTERFIGRMEEVGIWHNNAYGSPGTTIAVQAKPHTFFGANGKTQYDVHFPIT